VKSPCIAVPKEKAEEVRRKLMEMDLMRRGLKVKRDDRNVYFPVKEKVSIEGCLFFMEDFEKVEKKSYMDILREKKIEPDSISIDFVGSIAILRLKDEDIAREIGEAILESNKNVRTVCLDRGVRGDYRLRDIKIIAGEKTTETMHVEYGLRMKMDIAKTYFSPRLATERMRVAKQIEKGSVVIDMFAGVAPFSLVIAKYANPSKIYAIDINPYAVKYAKENVMINGFSNVIEIIEGNAKDVIDNLPYADNIIMNLPHSGFQFLPYAMRNGKIIHYYEIMERGEEEKRIGHIKSIAEKHGYAVEVKNLRRVGSYSPSKQKMGMELYIKHI